MCDHDVIFLIADVAEGSVDIGAAVYLGIHADQRDAAHRLIADATRGIAEQLKVGVIQDLGHHGPDLFIDLIPFSEHRVFA